MIPSIPLKPHAALPLALLALACAGCPDTTENPGAPPVGKLSHLQTIVASDDPDIDTVSNFVMSPGGEKMYVTTWHSQVLTLDRSPVDGSLARAYAAPLYNASGLAMTADGAHLYAVGANNPDQLMRFDVDPLTGEPVPKAYIFVRVSQLAIAGEGAFLYESSLENGSIASYRIDPGSGAITPGLTTPHDSPLGNVAFLVDDEHGSLFANKVTPDGSFIVRYAVNPSTGALTQQAQTAADLQWGLTILARCPGTTRVYVPQEAGSIGYADIGGTGLIIPASFAHPDLSHVRSASLSADCKNLYAITQQGSNGSLVVLARDEAGELSWLQTIPMGPGTTIFAITGPRYASASDDGKNVYVGSGDPGEGFAVFRRDPTGAGF